MHRTFPAHRHAAPTRAARLVLVTIMAAALAGMLARPAGAQGTKLVVTIVVDQLRGDLIDHYSPAFTGGFRRMLDEGLRFSQASHAHARTSTAPGHATLTTGVFPARHGIVANSWQQRRGLRWQPMYAVEDPDSPILGFENEPMLAGRSPRNLLRAGLPDWIGSADPASRRVSISRKDRAAVPMGGQSTEHVYWILPELGRFITSTSYMERYPDWLRRFNDRVMPRIYEPRVWESGVPEAFAHLVRADSADYEFDGVHTTFPHRSEDENPDDSEQQHNVWASELPFADDAVMALAAEVIEQLELGQRQPLDYLAIGLSAFDRVGHQFGPFSHESFTTMLNIDRRLGELFELLDEEVGEGAWLVGLSADHGVVTMPEHARAMGDDNAERILRESVLGRLTEGLNVAARAAGAPPVIAERLARWVESEGVADRAYTHYDLTRGAPADSFAIQYRNSYYPGRAWDDLGRFGVDLRYGEGDLIGSQTGTNHETVYWYDRWVPMIFMGGGIPAGVSEEQVYTVDFAPTLAGLAGIPVPDDLDGRRIF